MNKQKIIKIIAIAALVGILIFSVTLVMSFLEFGGTVVFVICIASGVIGLGLFFVMKMLTRKQKELPPGMVFPDTELEEPNHKE